MPLWFDAHLDLAYLAVSGRDLTAPLDPAAGPHAPAAVTLPELAAGNVRFALATIFTEAGGHGPEGYPEGDTERAHAVGRAQMEVYLTWRDAGLLALDLHRVLTPDPHVGAVRGGMGVAETLPHTLPTRIRNAAADTRLHAGILIENADPIRSPDELGWWVQRGVVAVGLAWVKPSRYAGGNSTDLGLTDLGRALVREMDRLNIVHDASHLSDCALDQLLELTARPLIASHSNCRALLTTGAGPVNQRHLTDSAIQKITARGGVIGLNLFAKFLDPTLTETPAARPPIAACLRHIDHVCELAGDRAHVGLGSDMDGGFSAGRLPEGIDSPRTLFRLSEALSGAGWTDDEVFGFTVGNWARFFSERTQPARS